MSRDILVQAQADHIESLFHGSPLAAVEELVWNALDADAHEVRIDLITNGLQGIEGIRVSDDGTGIDILRADATFGSLGGSWKRGSEKTPNTHRRLHGRRGCGRFKAFALGCLVEWRTTVRMGNDFVSYKLWGEADRPGVFHLDATEDGPLRGTEVYVSNVRMAADSLAQTVETVQHLAAKFALYLKSYPNVRIYFNGLPVTPVIVEKRSTEYVLTLENGAEAKLQVIEWKRRFTGSGRLVFAGPDGFQLHEQPSGVRTGSGVSYTAYLIAPRFLVLNAENALVMDELNPEVRQYLDAARRTLRSHFAVYGGERVAFEREWEDRLSTLSAAECAALAALARRVSKAKAKTEAAEDGRGALASNAAGMV